MPYIICVNRPGCPPEQDPYAVATLDDAREAAATEYIESWTAHADRSVPASNPGLNACYDLPETGGVIGPMPDGYVIDVRRVSYPELAKLSGDNHPYRRDELCSDTRDQILDTYNA